MQRKLFAVGQQELGDGQVLCQWSPRGPWLAAAGNKRVVLIYDNSGKLYGEIHLAPREVPAADPHQCCCLQLQWDASGETLAVLPAGCSFVYTWTAATRELQKLDTDFKAQEATMLCWSNCSAVLAVGTVKGNLQLYFIKEHRKMPVLAKHTKRVCAGAWALSENTLAMAALDRTLTISNLSGDTLQTVDFKGDPLQLCAAVSKDERPGSAKTKDTTFSLVTSKRTLCIVQGSTKDASAGPLELSFMESYGNITQHLWFGDGFVLVGFRSGQVVVVSSLSKEVSREVHSHRPLDMLQDMAYCPAISRVAIGGGSTIKLLDVGADYGEVASRAVELPAGHVVNKLSWGQDGQVLTVATANGLLVTYLASLPTVFAAAGTRHAMLTSLGEVTVHNVVTHSSSVVQVDCEPSFCSLGPQHLAVGVNNQVLFYTHGGQGGSSQLVNRRSYLGGVHAVCLNSTHAAVLSDGRVLLHAIDASGSDAAEDMCLPQPGAARSEPVTCAALSHHFLVTATAAGHLRYHMVQDGALAAVNEFRHTRGRITHLYPQPFGPKLVLADDQMAVGLFSPLTDELTPLPQFEGSLEQVLWDEDDGNLFVASNTKGQLFTYLLTQQSLSGQKLELLSAVSLPVGHKPVLLADGRLSVRLKSGAVDTWVLETHKPLLEQGGDVKQLQRRLTAAIKLKRLPEALDAARALGSADGWRQVAAAAVQQLDVRLAVAAYRQAGDAPMVMSLCGLEEVEDRNLLAGSLMVLLEQDYNQAQELLLRSGRPLAALEMRQDLKHWPEALALAQRLAPDRVPALSKEHAAMLEMVGEYAEARSHYQQALDALEALQQGDPQLQQVCLAGMARILLHLGDLRGGKALAQQLGSSSLWKECARILEGMQQPQDAAEMYEQAGMSEKAAGIYITARNWAAAAPLMARVTSAKLQLQFAKAKESEGSYADAAAAYEAAGDLDSAVRLSLEKLGALGRAAALSRKSRSTPAAALVARAAVATGEVELAVEFLLLAGQLDQAFDLAAAKGQLETFGQLAAANSKVQDDAVRMAQYLEGRGQPEMAADVWAGSAAQAERAISLYAQVCSASSLTKAIQVLEDSQLSETAPMILAALERCSSLQAHVRDALRLRLNMASGQLAEAARDALELARREQEEGNYKLAHSKMFSTLQQLQAMGASAPLEFRQALALLHSYVLVKSLLAVGDHMGAARMLVRVAGNISKFPKHVVPILTSTVIECQRAGLKKTALEYACTLMRPEYRSEVSEKYRKKIELMVRKPDKGDEPQEGLSTCPFCHLPGPETQLQCVSCQSLIPCDIATGKRMTLQDWCECPSCRMPCSSQPFLAILTAEGKCPMCSAGVSMQDVRQVPDVGGGSGGGGGFLRGC